MSLDLGRPSGPTHPTGPAGPGPTGPAGPSPSGPVGPHPSPSGPPSPSPTSGTGAPWPARPGGSSGPGGPAGPGREDWLAALIDDVDAEHVAAASRARAAVESLALKLGADDPDVRQLAQHHGIKLPVRPSIHGPEGLGGPGLATSGVEVRPAPGYDVASGSATPGSGRGFADPDAGARAGGGPDAVPGAPRLVPVPAIPGQLDPRHWLANVGIGPQYDSLPGLATGTADYRRLP